MRCAEAEALMSRAKIDLFQLLGFAISIQNKIAMVPMYLGNKALKIFTAKKTNKRKTAKINN